MLFRQCPNTEVKLITKLYGWDDGAHGCGVEKNGQWVSSVTKISREIHKLELNQVRQLIRDLTFATELAVNTYTGAGEKPQLMIDAATVQGIDAGAIRSTVSKEAKARAAQKGMKKPKASKVATPTKPVQAELPVSPTIDVASMNCVDDIRNFIVANPTRFDELVQEIISNASHHIGNLESAAASVGYIYSTAGWQKAPSLADAGQSSPALGESGAQAIDIEPGQRSTIRIKPKAENAAADAEQAQSIGPIVRIKKQRAALGKEDIEEATAPATAWPFPQIVQTNKTA
ncbi:hypothetical protein AAKU55_005730 [Oxalobacteraceae bacterium GrIS 1.11]